MRSNQAIISILGIESAQRLAKLIVGSDAVRQAASFADALYAGVSCRAYALCVALGHGPTATCATTHVTGGAGGAMWRARSGKRNSKRFPAAS